MNENIHEAFKKEGVFVTSPLNYIVYESGFKAGIKHAQKTAHNSDYAKLCDSCLDRKECTWQTCEHYRKA